MRGGLIERGKGRAHEPAIDPMRSMSYRCHHRISTVGMKRYFRPRALGNAEALSFSFCESAWSKRLRPQAGKRSNFDRRPIRPELFELVPTTPFVDSRRVCRLASHRAAN